MSTAAAPAAEAPAVAAAAGKKGAVLKLIVAVLLAAGLAGGGAFFYMSKKLAATSAAKAAAAAGEAGEDSASAAGEGALEPTAAGLSPADFFALAPQFVVNLNDAEAMRFLQVEVQVIARKPAAMEAVKLNDPVVRNRLMLLFSSQTYHALLSREGKEKLQADAAAEINKVLDEHKKPHINGVVFTNLVMQ